MFKKFVKRIATLTTNDEAQVLWGEIDRAFQQEKITWDDHQTLFAILSKLAF